ncbi:dihydroxyacetone kinase [Cystobasidium minutum MCA 4210]|uniref:dihydroxyacetone kinase n=1 Tax=Cystobasidium minutum MCA 4210 TaxID=1397322 RepID=UPI0034CFD4E7|eukprot:jgi/Rhomi1/88260/CE88259_2677
MAQNKHIVNDPRNLANESLAGLARVNAKIKVDATHRVVYAANVPQDRVALISGGGSGHEPAHAGFVGDGLLTAAVAGNVFASPNVAQVRKGLELVNNKKGTLIVIMRYTGDVLLFGLAKEQSSVTNPDHPVKMTIVGDDVAVGRKQGALVGRRGLAGTVLVYKCASALADEGADIDAVYEMSEYVNTRVGTIGVGLEHCHIPGTAISEAHLKESEIELGMGIHNEAGIEKIKLPTSKELIKRMLGLITDTSDEDRAYVPFKHDGKDEVVLLVNNLGGISNLEMFSIANDAVEELTKNKITVRRVTVGSVMTSLNLPGFSLTCLLLPRQGDKFSPERILQLIDSPASAPGWTYITTTEPGAAPDTKDTTAPKPIKNASSPVAPADFALFEKAVSSACNNVVAAEPEITKFDTIAGDGDCGLCFKAMAEGVLNAFKAGKVDKNDVTSAMVDIGTVIEKEGDGTSGAIFFLFMTSLAGHISAVAKSQNAKTDTKALWAEAVSRAFKSLQGYTLARKPSRTLMDPLEAFVESFSADQDLDKAVAAAQQATEDTKKMVAKAGRATYVNQDDLMKADIPDPGAMGITKLLEGLQAALK